MPRRRHADVTSPAERRWVDGARRERTERKEIHLGVTFLRAKVINPEQPRKSRGCEFLVDSGVVYSVVPESILKKLGIKSTSFRGYILANEEVIRKAVGNAYFKYEGQVGAAPVVFGDEDVFLLGATTLEAPGMILDPSGENSSRCPCS